MTVSKASWQVWRSELLLESGPWPLLHPHAHCTSTGYSNAVWFGPLCYDTCLESAISAFKDEAHLDDALLYLQSTSMPRLPRPTRPHLSCPVARSSTHN